VKNATDTRKKDETIGREKRENIASREVVFGEMLVSRNIFVVACFVRNLLLNFLISVRRLGTRFCSWMQSKIAHTGTGEELVRSTRGLGSALTERKWFSTGCLSQRMRSRLKVSSESSSIRGGCERIQVTTSKSSNAETGWAEGIEGVS
jgi:hypothetical protein